MSFFGTEDFNKKSTALPSFEPGIHTNVKLTEVKYEQVKKKDGTGSFDCIRLNFELEDGTKATELLWEPKLAKDATDAQKTMYNNNRKNIIYILCSMFENGEIPEDLKQRLKQTDTFEKVAKFAESVFEKRFLPAVAANKFENSFVIKATTRKKPNYKEGENAFQTGLPMSSAAHFFVRTDLPEVVSINLTTKEKETIAMYKEYNSQPISTSYAKTSKDTSGFDDIPTSKVEDDDDIPF